MVVACRSSSRWAEADLVAVAVAGAAAALEEAVAASEDSVEAEDSRVAEEDPHGEHDGCALLALVPELHCALRTNAYGAKLWQ